jgi:hypothetical protein
MQIIKDIANASGTAFKVFKATRTAAFDLQSPQFLIFLGLLSEEVFRPAPSPPHRARSKTRFKHALSPPQRSQT